MAYNTGLHGAYPLNDVNVDVTASSRSRGVYALGRTGQDNLFYVAYVGRSDDDLNGRLKQWVGKYSEFMYGYLPTAAECYDKECALYHDLSPRDNTIHPAKPKVSRALACAAGRRSVQRGSLPSQEIAHVTQGH